MYNQGFPCRKVREDLEKMSLRSRPMGAQAAIGADTFILFTL